MWDDELAVVQVLLVWRTVNRWISRCGDIRDAIR